MALGLWCVVCGWWVVIDAVLVAMAMLKTRVKKLKFAKRIFLITDAAGAIGDDASQIETIAGVMIEDGMWTIAFYPFFWLVCFRQFPLCSQPFVILQVSNWYV